MAIKRRYSQIRDALLTDIQHGVLLKGDRLPSERDIADRFQVSSLTARRAITELVDSGIVVRRARQRPVLSAGDFARMPTRILHVIIGDYEGLGVGTIIRAAVEECDDRGWTANILHVSSHNPQPAVRAIQSISPSIVISSGALVDGALRQSLSMAEGWSVLVGMRSADPMVPSVLADDRIGLTMAIEHLKRHGHRKIGLLGGGANMVMQQMVEVWRSYFAESAEPAVLQSRLMVVQSANGEHPGHQIYDTVRAYFASGRNDVTAFICIMDEIVPAAVLAIRDSGLRVPEDISIMGYGNTAAGEFSAPPVTTVDVNMAGHIKVAFEMIESRLRDELPAAARFRMVRPSLVERRSVLPAASGL